MSNQTRFEPSYTPRAALRPNPHRTHPWRHCKFVPTAQLHCRNNIASWSCRQCVYLLSCADVHWITCKL